MNTFKIKKFIPKVSKNLYTTNCSYFTEFLVSENINMNLNNYVLNKVETSSGEISISSKKLVDTIKGTSIEGVNLTGKKLIILGDLKLKLLLNLYKGRSSIEKLCYIKKCIPFSTYIILPDHICSDEKINLQYMLQDLTTSVICCNKLFVNACVFIKFCDQYEA